MSLATGNDKCMFFVGGNDYKSMNPTGQSLAGGCTKEWWDAEVASTDAETAMGKLMGTDGEPIVSTTVTHSQSGSNTKLFSGGDFHAVEAGMLLYHPNSGYPFSGGPGFFKILEVDPASGSWVVVDLPWSSIHASNDGDVVFVGGAWSSIDTLCESYIDAFDYSQEVWVNKDLSPTAQWDWADWSGDVYNNTWFKVTGFHRVPGDITEPGGTYFQTAKDMKDSGVHANKLVDVDMSGLSGDLISGDNAFNITMRGFHFNNAAVANGMFELSANAWGNIDLDHNAFEYSVRIDVHKCRNLLIRDSLITPSSVCSDVVINMDGTSVVTFLNNYVKQDNPTTGINVPLGAVYFGAGNVFDLEGAYTGVLSASEALVISFNNTYTDFASEDGNGLMRANAEGTLVSMNDIIFNNKADARAFEVAKFGGSHITENLCAYSEEGQITELIYLHVDEATGNIRKHDIENLLEVDPLLDGDYEPLEEQVRTGGTPDILGDATAIGAIKTMNTTVINTTVQAALTSQGYTTGRAPYLDALNGGMKLSADGLDNIVVAEPSGSPSGWSLAQCLRWLIMRFMNKHTSDNFSGIVVHKDDGSVSTSQAVTEVDGVKAVGKAQ